MKLRPQVAVWEREVLSGPGITGLWRADPAVAAGRVFTFRQNGYVLSGSIEGARGGRFFFFGSETPVAIEDGKVDGANISFNAASFTYTGIFKGDVIELLRTGGPAFGRQGRPAPSEPRPAIGPPPDGSDPSSAALFGLARGGFRGPQTPVPIVLHRAQR